MMHLGDWVIGVPSSVLAPSSDASGFTSVQRKGFSPDEQSMLTLALVAGEEMVQHESFGCSYMRQSCTKRAYFSWGELSITTF